METSEFKLKTLKDIEVDHICWYPEALKQEAIKWVEEFKKLNGKTSLGKFGKNTSAGVCYGLIHFFNLTEEDLK